MTPRLDPFAAAPKTMQAMLAFERFIRKAGLEPSLFDLVKIRASQINGCAYCLHMHTRDARAAGESEERLYVLSAWRESPLYTQRERAALAWTEALTLVAETRAPDEDYERACEAFEPEELVNFTVLIGVINVWTRIAIGFRSVHPMEASAARAAAG